MPAVSGGPYQAKWQEHPQQFGRQPPKSATLIQRLAPGHAGRVAMVQHIQLDHGNPDYVDRNLDPAQGIDQEVAAIATAAEVFDPTV